VPSGRETRKTVTVVFVDVTGSTGLGERLDPESLRHILSRYFDGMRTVFERHGGVVEKFIGDAVVAVFGIPEVHEDDALRAVRAVADMAATLRQLNDELQEEQGLAISVRTGVNTGEVVVGDPGPGQQLVLGDAVNVAARLEQTAEPGEILLGEATVRLVKDAVEVEVLASRTVKGKEHPVRAYRLVRVKPGVSGHTRRLDSPMVGREHELILLTQAYARVARERACHLFTVLGSAGVGKSRLLEEFLHTIKDEASVLRGRCLPYGDGITFWPIAEIVKQAAGITENNIPAQAAEKLQAALEKEKEGSLIAERLGQLIGLREGAAVPEETFWAVRKLLESLARKRPLAIVFDDIHWGQPTFLDLVEHIADWIRDVPLLLVCVARQELLDLRPAWAGGKLNVTSISLEPLRTEECSILMFNLLGTGESVDSALRGIVESAEGNPLFVEEILSMLIDDGLLQREDGHWVPTGDLSRVPVPSSIQALLAVRLERLSQSEREVIERASVEGRVFHRGALVELLPEESRLKVAANLMTLSRKEMIRSEQPEFPGEDAFRFRHLLIRDSAYQAMPKELRAELHERFASWLERVAAGRLGLYEEILGYHLEQAHHYRKELRPGDARAGELGRRGGERLAAAGREALARGDVPAVINFFQRAVSMLPGADPARTALLPGLAAALGARGEFAEAEALLNEAIEKAHASADRGVEAHAQVEMLALRALSQPEGLTERTLREMPRIMPIFERLGDDRGLARCWLILAGAHITTLQFPATEDAARHAFVHARRAGDRGQEGESLSVLTLATYWGRATLVGEGFHKLDEILKMSRGNRGVEAAVLVARAGYEAKSGRVQEARRLHAAAKAILLDLGLKVQAGGISMIAFDIESAAGNPSAAEPELRTGYQLLRRMGEKSYLSTVAGYLAEAVYAQGRYGEAEELSRESQESADKGDALSQMLWRRIRGKLLARQGDTEQALKLAEEALALAAGTSGARASVDAYLEVAEIFNLLGRRHDAVALIEKAAHLYEETGDTLSARRARGQLEGQSAKR
jgi:class 3 adenylate cyclase/tetratricopeptide (TPR) repeat protein